MSTVVMSASVKTKDTPDNKFYIFGPQYDWISGFPEFK